MPMALETGTYINSLNASNPASTDGLAQADDHIRLLKSTIKATLPNVTGAITATQAELNLMDGVTATTAELNVTDGLTATTAELNTLDGITSTVAELNILDGVTATAAELNITDGLTATTAELNHVDGVTSNIQTQLDTKYVSTTQAEAVWETGTSTTESIVSPAKVKAAIDFQVSTAPVWVATDSVSTYSATGLSAYNTWVKTPITNTVISNLSGAATDTTNYEIDLPAGTYYVEWTLPIARVASDTADKVGVRFRNVTDNVSVGASQQMKLGDWQNLNFHGCGKFTIAGTKSFQLQAWSSETVTLRYGHVISGDLATFAIIKVYKA